MEQKEDKPFYVSRVYWNELILLPAFCAILIAIPMISISQIFPVISTKAVIIIYLILIIIGTFISAKFFIRKYVFYENRLEIVFIYREIRNRTILYDNILEVFYWRREMPKAPSSRMVLKLKSGKSKALDIEEKYAQAILLELKKRNLPVELKVRSIYNRFSKKR